MPTTITKSISGGNNDCTLYFASGNWIFSLNAQPTMVGAIGNGTAVAWGSGLRWTNILIPPGSFINSAHITFTSSPGDTEDTVRSQFHGDAEDNAAVWSDGANYVSRRGTVVGGADNSKITAAVVAWDAIPHWTATVGYDSPELKTIIQEIVSRPGWASGNAIAIFWDDHADRSNHGFQTTRRSPYVESGGTLPVLSITYSSPPQTVTTNAVSPGVDRVKATLNGTLTDGGSEPCDCGFEWGETVAYGNTTATQSKTTGQTFAQLITGLKPAQTYHFRALASNISGSVVGADQTFKTSYGQSNALSRRNV